MIGFIGFLILLPKVVKMTFTFKVEVTVGKKLWIELTYEILRQVVGFL